MLLLGISIKPYSPTTFIIPWLWSWNVISNSKYFNICCSKFKMFNFHMPFYRTCPKLNVACNDPLLPFCLFLNESKRDNMWKANITSQLLHLVTITNIPIVHNKKYLWNKLVTITSSKLGLRVKTIRIILYPCPY